MILEAVFKEEAEMKSDFGVLAKGEKGDKGDKGDPGVVDYSLVANALKGSVSGSVVSMTDVSPLEHNIGVKLASKNLFDTNSNFYNVYFQGTGDPQNLIYSTDSASYLIPCVPNATYTISHSNSANAVFRVGYIKAQKEDVGTTDVDIFNPHRGTTEKSLTITTGEGATYIIVQLSKAEVESTKNSLQCELGTTATEYTPFVQDISSVTLTKYGKNLFDFNTATTTWMVKGEDGSFTQSREDTRANLQLTLNAYKGNEYVKRLQNPIDVFSTGKWSCSFEYDETFDTLRFGHNGSTNNVMCIIPLQTLPKGTCSFSVLLTNVTQGSFSWKDIQIEAGNTATEYEPFKEPIPCNAPNADGTVESVPSLYPTTTLLTDTEGVTITAEYNKDLNKVVNDIYQKLSALGVAVLNN